MKRAQTPQQARDQASESFGFLASKLYDLGGGETLELPHPEFFDDDQQAAYDALQLESETWDHDEIERSNPLTGEIIVHPETGKPVVDRRLKVPHRKTVDGATTLMENFNIRVCKILWGPAGYKKFKAAGGRANQVAVDLRMMQVNYRARVDADPKSASGDTVAETVPD
jgi:hypothetical protein